MLLCNNGILILTRTSYFGMMYVTLLPTVSDLLAVICYRMYLVCSLNNTDEDEYRI